MYDGVWQYMEIKYILLSKISLFQKERCPFEDFEKVYIQA